MIAKDYKVIAAILARVGQDLHLNKDQKSEMVADAQIILQESYDDFNPVTFEEYYHDEVEDLSLAEAENQEMGVQLPLLDEQLPQAQSL